MLVIKKRETLLKVTIEEDFPYRYEEYAVFLLSRYSADIQVRELKTLKKVDIFYYGTLL